MLTSFLLKDLAGDFSIHLCGDQRVKEFAKKYGINETLMLLRIQEVAKTKGKRK